MIDIGRLLDTLATRKLWILAGAIFAASALATIDSITVPTYRSEVLVSVVGDPSGGAANALSGGQLGTIASLVGVDIGGKESRRSEILATLSSRVTISEFIDEYGLMPVLFWKQWDEQRSTWRHSFLRKSPTKNDGVQKFLEAILFVTEDKKTGLVRVAVEWKDPKLCAQWANALVLLVNRNIRASAVAEARRNIDFLNKELAKIDTVEVRQAAYQLVESGLNRIMVASGQEQYALKVIDPAEAPDADGFVRPNRILDIFLGGLCGSIAVAGIVAFGRRKIWWTLNVEGDFLETNSN